MSAGRDGRSFLADRFAFGRNWLRYAQDIDETRVGIAAASLSNWLGDIDGRSFLDIGCGSGLFSLAATRLGADVSCFDFDDESVRCAEDLKQRYEVPDESWKIYHGSVLDGPFMAELGLSDIVYSWGVLHHTGDLWAALEAAVARVAPGGVLYIALYNDAGRASGRWLAIKRTYNRARPFLRWALLACCFVRLWGPSLVRDALRGDPLATWRGYPNGAGGRGMSPATDLVDWVGGYPFEYAKPDAVHNFCVERGLSLARMKTVITPQGCNEFLFRR
jgi:2-polyprenyl-6-hydroxyphenyl methylase/3-demethylubiquinone-9 3-methyltransferase